MPGETFPIISRRAERMKRVQKAQHLTGALVLITAALGHLEHGVHLLPVLEITAAVALIASVIVARVRGEASGHGVAWVELAGAAMVTVEAIAKLEQPHHVSFYILSFVQPVVLLLFAVFDSHIAAMRLLRADESAFTMRTRIFFRRRVAWSDVKEWHPLADGIEVREKDGKTRTLRFRDLVNRAEALEWAAAQFARHVSAPEELPGGQSGADQGQGDQEPVALQDRAE
jgi:hypothetical protein